MSARIKLNAIYILAAVSFAAAVAFRMKSGLAFCLVALFLLAVLLYGGDIRPTSRRRR